MALIPRIERAAFPDHLAAETPCVIAGAARDWPATRWTPASLAERLGPLPIKYKQSPTGKHPNFEATTLKDMFATGTGTFAELFASFTGPDPATRLFTGDEQWLVRRRDGVTTVHEPLRPLLDDAVIPNLFPADRLYTVWAWFSGAGARTWLHYDNNACHNLNAQLTGTKECTLFPPSALDQMRLFPVGGSNPAVNCSQIDLATETPDAPSFTARLEAGDLLFIPAWWLHGFVHLGAFNANLNFWWKPEHPTTNPVSERQASIDATQK